jgi:ABC-type branched-subunit amino acid transport system ATPase component
MSKLVIKNLHAGYVSGIEILKGIDLDIHDGEVLGVIGLNGSGKSTLGKSIMNLLPYRTGQLIFEGKDISLLPARELSRLGISIMRQGGQVFTTMTVQENLDLAFGNNKDKAYRELITKMIPLLNESSREMGKRTADKLSGGQRHQLALAMALATKPSLLILDEPSAGLSPVSVEKMYELLEIVKRTLHVTIILIEQNINKAISFCDRSILLSQGTIGKTFENLGEEEMRKAVMEALGL